MKTHFTNSSPTVDWFHVVQLFTEAINEVRLGEAKEIDLPKATRWTTLKNAEGQLSGPQIDALAELMAMDLHTSRPGESKKCSVGCAGHLP